MTRRQPVARLWLAALAATVALIATAPAQVPPGAQRAERSRVILLSVDGTADWLVDRYINEGRAPALAQMRRLGASADALVPPMPTLTAPAHATLWTGAWPRQHGVTGNAVSRAPGDHTVLEWQSGFDSTVLRAEPIWVTAARAGRTVFVPQATGGFPFDSRHADRLLQFDVYANQFAQAHIVENSLDDQFHFMVADTPFVLDRADGTDRLRLRSGEDEWQLRAGRLGRFTPPIAVRLGTREASVRFRLLAFDPESTAFRLFHGVAAEITSNRPDRIAEFRSATGALVGEQAAFNYQSGRFGPTYAEDGDGLAEFWLTDMLLTNQEYFEGVLDFAAGEPWDLLVLYAPNFDAAGHALGGMVDRANPRYSAGADPRAWAVLGDLFSQVVDGFVADIRRRFPNATLVVTSDHGMGGAGRLILPNVALREQGLLNLDASGEVDLSRTQAVFVQAKGHAVFVNRVRWRQGIVLDAERYQAAAKAQDALLSIRDPRTGAPVVRAIFDREFDGLGLGMGDEAIAFYFDPMPGYYTNGRATGDIAVIDAPPTGVGFHGAAPWRRDMHTIFYAAGPGVAAGKRLGMMRGIDVAPTVARLLGIPPPADSVGRAYVLGE